MGITSILDVFETENPHWQRDRCYLCHQFEPEGIASVDIDEIDSICLACHNGQEATREIHAIGRKLESGQDFVQPKGWPLVEGKLGCVTCHNIKIACDPAQKRPLVNPEFLRDRWVGNKNNFCQNCHRASSFGKLNPHIMISGSRVILYLGEQNEINETACLFCHKEIPDRYTLVRTGRSQLRSPEKVLCKICHRTHKTYYEPGHMGAIIPDEMQVFMYARELLGTNVFPDNLLLQRLARSGAKPTRMITDSQGKITCTTCHNPHQENVFGPESELSHNSMWLKSQNKIVSPSSSNKTCLHCHK